MALNIVQTGQSDFRTQIINLALCQSFQFLIFRFAGRVEEGIARIKRKKKKIKKNKKNKEKEEEKETVKEESKDKDSDSDSA